MKFLLSLVIVSCAIGFAFDLFAQTTSSTHIGGYGEIDYNRADSGSTLNIPRLVLFVSHQFDPAWSFKSELEVENTKIEGAARGGEFEVEQAFIDYQLSSHVGFRGGLMLIPSGIINQTHEPTTFFSVGRPHVDQQVIPSTWREIGVGAHAEVGEVLQLQAMIGEGMSATGYSEIGIYEGRQQGANAMVDALSLSAKIDYLPLVNLRVGGSIYYQSNTASKTKLTVAGAPAINISSPLSVIAFDVRYDLGSLHVRGEYAMDNIGGSAVLSTALSRPIPNMVSGGYIEAGFNVMPIFSASSDVEIIPFARFESLHHAFDAAITTNQELQYTMLGLSVRPLDGVIMKVNYEIASKAVFPVTEHEFMSKDLLSIGLGYMF